MSKVKRESWQVKSSAGPLSSAPFNPSGRCIKKPFSLSKMVMMIIFFIPDLGKPEAAAAVKELPMPTEPPIEGRRMSRKVCCALCTVQCALALSAVQCSSSALAVQCTSTHLFSEQLMGVFTSGDYTEGLPYFFMIYSTQG